jgi:hypothetical protein
MQIKWKIFFALNLLLVLYAIVLLIATTATLSKFSHKQDSFILSIIFIFSFAVMAMNGILNVFLLRRFYLAKLIPAIIKSLSHLFLIITAIVTVVIFLTCLIGAREIFNARDGHHVRTTTLTVSFLVVAIQTAILIMQEQLPRLIQLNYQSSMHSLIDSIGQTPEQEN